MTLALAVCLAAAMHALATPKTSGTQPAGRPPACNAFFAPPAHACALDAACARIPADARALIILDARLHGLIASGLHDYAAAAAQRRRFTIAVLPIAALDDQRPETLRAALQRWHAARPRLEGVVFAGNVKLPSFFLPRADIHSVRLWPRYFEDLDMVATRRVAAGTVLRGEGAPAGSWPRVVGVKELTVPAHDFDDLAEGPNPGPELWGAFLPVGFVEAERNDYRGWAAQLGPFLKKATAFHQGAVKYDRGFYLVSNDLGLLARSRPVWNAVGPGQIEFFAVNDKGPGAFKNNPAGYQRAPLERFESLDAFLAYAKDLPWMDEGWQAADLFLRDMARSRRRVVWWNVHSDPGCSLISWEQARTMRGGGLIALLNGCSVGGFCQPGSGARVDTRTVPDRNVLVNLVYGASAFVAALGSTHDRVTDERATPLLGELYSGGYLGRAHFLRLEQQHRDARGNPAQLREFQELLVGDPFADAQ
ncbi:MAG: hypothetical protein JXQ71_07845 [Verrucomicrobia bacterium]|nr:hypothetical protein [Verrucomicrobiota bacterium]